MSRAHAQGRAGRGSEGERELWNSVHHSLAGFRSRSYLARAVASPETVGASRCGSKLKNGTEARIQLASAAGQIRRSDRSTGGFEKQTTKRGSRPLSTLRIFNLHNYIGLCTRLASSRTSRHARAH